MSDHTTNPGAEVYSTADLGGEDTIAELVIVHYGHDPRRVGERARFPDQKLEHVFGRGRGDGRELRVELARRRPGEAPGEPGMFEDDTAMPKRLLQFTALPVGFHVKVLAEDREVFIDGVPMTEGVAFFGQNVRVRNRIVLYATRRRVEPPLRYLRAIARGSFGEADAHGNVGESGPAWILRNDLAFAASADKMHVLLLGETGTGKELGAVAVHKMSARAGRPFLAFNAAAMPATLVDDELFGHAKNYPQGNTPERMGLVMRARDGTLFLDEIGELPADLQAKILRLMDPGEFKRLGEEIVRRCEARIVAATNRQPEQLKADLGPRFGVKVRHPSLRERIEDIPLLARHLALRVIGDNPDLDGERFVYLGPSGRREVRMSEKFVEALMRCPYPGNTRELLEDVVGAIKRSPRTTLHPWPELLAKAKMAAPEKTEECGGRPQNVPASTYGQQKKAAERMGVSRHVLYRMRKKEKAGGTRGGGGDAGEGGDE